ncbi:hypothetical protein GETHLI_04920 [Geothrix limicola]|uniref:Outer membrane protein beta-barrel domain-containing protein n=1 Tax=Geothrix limicola TaxID=2927978 RepID=A0ABQ5QCY0_9BACT|nr:outer membrane beta-barrel protein [Geothrix limicola]GLH71990.1 hypothetical protein GETHLI_04920 [Geothrix limicola]
MALTLRSLRPFLGKLGTGTLATALGLALATLPARADNPDGPYLGVGSGQFKLNIQNLDDAGTAANSILHSSNNAQKYFAGYRFSPNWAIEAAYIDLGRCGDHFTATGSNGNYRVNISGFSPALIGSLPIGPFELSAKIGEYYYDSKLHVDFDAGPAIESSHRRNDLLYGGGLGLTFFDHLHVRAEYETIELQSAKHSDAFWLSAAWRF